MAQHSMIILDDDALPVLNAFNAALRALVTLSAGPDAPETTYPCQLWYDTVNNILKMRSEADDGWINMFYLDQAAGALRLLQGMQVVDATGAQKGRIDVQAEGVWNAGTGTVESLICPAKLKAAIEELAPKGGMTHLGTKATVGGTSAALTGLDLTGYKALMITFRGARVGSAPFGGQVAQLAINGVNIAAVADVSAIDGGFHIDLTSGAAFGSVLEKDLYGNELDRHIVAGASTLTTASTSVTLTASGTGIEPFSGGAFAVYGMK